LLDVIGNFQDITHNKMHMGSMRIVSIVVFQLAAASKRPSMQVQKHPAPTAPLRPSRSLPLALKSG
jgi:hypothetical protein